MMYKVVDAFVEVLTAAPDSLLPASRVGAVAPDGSNAVPCILIGLALAAAGGEGISKRGPYPPDKEPALFVRYAGTATLEIWSTSPSATDLLARRVQDRLQREPQRVRDQGFWSCRPHMLDVALPALHTPPTGSPFPVWKQRLTYEFVFEAEEAETLPGGGPIQKIDIDVDDRLVETFSVP